MGYIIGIDMGIASVGWAVLKTNDRGDVCAIKKLGVRTFPIPEKLDDGGSLKEARRIFRGARRTLRRKKARIKKVKELCLRELNVNFDELLSCKNGKLLDIYELRGDAALNRKLTNEEFARLLVHFAQRRGYKSNRKEDSSIEGRKVLSAIKQNEENLINSGCATIGEWLYKYNTITYNGQKYYITRNKAGEYKFFFARKDVEKEIRYIFNKQAEFGADFKKFEEEYLYIWNLQRPYDLGPNSGPYAAKSQSLYLDMLGKCRFDNNLRASKSTPTFEEYNLWTKLNNLTIYKGKEKVFLTQQQKELLCEYCITKEKVTYKQVRNFLTKIQAMQKEDTFVGLPYGQKLKKPKLDENGKKIKILVKDKKTGEVLFDNKTGKPKEITEYEWIRVSPEETEDKIKFVEFKSIPILKNNLGDDYSKISQEKLDKIVSYLIWINDHEELKKNLQTLNLPDEIVEKLLKLNISNSKPSRLSLEILYKLLPIIKQGVHYDKAMLQLGYNFNEFENENKKELLKFSQKEFEGINSPVALRSISQTIKVINAIIKKHGSPDRINIEVAREIGKSKEERDKINDQRLENELYNQKIVEEIKENYSIPSVSGKDIVKYKLAKEQNFECPYSFGKKIDASRLFEEGYVQVDHIIPYSISFDDSYNNKVLVFTEANQNKANRTPIQWLRATGGQAAVDRFVNWVSQKIQGKKKENLLTENPDESDFREKNIYDTRVATKRLADYIRNNLKFADETATKKVVTVAGGITSYLRKKFGIEKSRDNDEHHAIDAAIVAAINDGLIKRITQFNQSLERYFFNKKQYNLKFIDKITGEIIDDEALKKQLEEKFNLSYIEPYKGFSTYLKKLAYKNRSGAEPNPHISVSRMEKHKISGSAHGATLYGLLKDCLLEKKKDKADYFISRVPIEKVSLDAKTGDIKGIFYGDLRLKERLIQWLKTPPQKEVDKNGKTEYKRQPLIYNGIPVKRIKMLESTSHYVMLEKSGSVQNPAVASNGNMVRIDIFSKKASTSKKAGDEEYYFVPIYARDFYKSELPNVAFPSRKVMDEKDGYIFKFSLYPNDLIYIEHNSKVKFTKKTKDTNDLDDNGKPKEKNIETSLEFAKMNNNYLYYIKSNISTGSITVQTQNGEWTQNSLGIKTLRAIKKMKIDILGHITEAPFEKRNTKTFKKY